MPVAAIESLVALVDACQATTVSEFISIIQAGSDTLKSSVSNAISLSAGCDLFMRYIIQTLGNVGDIASCRDYLRNNGRLFVQRAKDARRRIALLGVNFVRDGMTVLLHAFSRVVIALLLEAADRGVRFKAIVTESRPSGLGKRAAKVLRDKGIPVSVVSDSATGYAMGKCDLVLVGAEGVVENGGIINALGTFQLAILARSAKKPFYVVAESHKFVRLFPLSQYDLPFDQDIITYFTDNEEAEKVEKEKEEKKLKNIPEALARNDGGIGGDNLNRAWGERPLVDFTGPEFITALITENGVLTPGAVSEELIRIWH
jgi:translation initiation factor eIF-2B subunit alpha